MTSSSYDDAIARKLAVLLLVAFQDVLQVPKQAGEGIHVDAQNLDTALCRYGRLARLVVKKCELAWALTGPEL